MQEAAGDAGPIPELGRPPGGGHGNPLQYSCLENPHGQRSLAVYSPQGHKESDLTEATLHARTKVRNLLGILNCGLKGSVQFWFMCHQHLAGTQQTEIVGDIFVYCSGLEEYGNTRAISNKGVHFSTALTVGREDWNCHLFVLNCARHVILLAVDDSSVRQLESIYQKRKAKAQKSVNLKRTV